MMPSNLPASVSMPSSVLGCLATLPPSALDAIHKALGFVRHDPTVVALVQRSPFNIVQKGLRK